jgi:hypothetical protein
MKYGIVVALICALFALPAVANEKKADDLRAHLRAINEIPSIITDASGEFRAEISDDETSIAFELSFENLSANLAASHIHIGERFANGGVSAFLCGGDAQPACPAATSGSISGTITAANVVGPAAQGVPAGNLAKLIRAIRAGVTYANMHNATFPAGEARGQIRADD